MMINTTIRKISCSILLTRETHLAVELIYGEALLLQA